MLAIALTKGNKWNRTANCNYSSYDLAFYSSSRVILV